MYSSIIVVRGVSRRCPLGLAALLHKLLRGVYGNVEDIQDMRVEIPGRHFGFECSQQLTELHRADVLTLVSSDRTSCQGGGADRVRLG